MAKDEKKSKEDKKQRKKEKARAKAAKAAKAAEAAKTQDSNKTTASSILARYGSNVPSTTTLQAAARSEALQTKVQAGKATRAPVPTAVDSSVHDSKVQSFNVDTLVIYPVHYMTMEGKMVPGLQTHSILKNNSKGSVAWAVMQAPGGRSITFASDLARDGFNGWLATHAAKAHAAVTLYDPRDAEDKSAESPYVILSRKKGKFEALPDEPSPDGQTLSRSCAPDLSGKARSSPVKVFLALRFEMPNSLVPDKFLITYPSTQSDGEEEHDPRETRAQSRKRAADSSPPRAGPSKKAKLAVSSSDSEVELVGTTISKNNIDSLSVRDTDDNESSDDNSNNSKDSAADGAEDTDTDDNGNDSDVEEIGASAERPSTPPLLRGIFGTGIKFRSPSKSSGGFYGLYKGLDY
ncbi:hypothetical protein AURDEDRAFT_177656 [Auricularia subglabra TFB-10046 SS5]|uniref:Uncharacterized protein n=1 Tax=Auricularia subglabra (strain TFB-10046 / SS5) TaxID=717982 RepID=J0D3K9_AURST|nr:hypothetical protein AURDEDRAFT_177656 [Auricularia subglabra TFB-10046 SS5]